MALRNREIYWVCVYCGEPADNMDHVKSRCSGGALNRRTNRGVCVPACRACNVALGAYPYPGIADRARHLYNVTYKKNIALLKMPHWSEQELDELSGGLRRSVKASIMAKAVVERRMAHMDVVSYLEDMTIDDAWDACKPAPRGQSV